MKERELDQTGIPGLDDILNGGLPHGHLYLVEGEPGTGKTTLAMQFLRAGANRGERTVYVTLSETAAEMRKVALSHGWNLDGIELVELASDVAPQLTDNEYTVFESTEVELGDTMKTMYATIESSRPTRVAIDSLSELRLLSRDTLRFRRQLLGLKRFLAEVGTTSLLLDDMTLELHGGLLQSIAHGVIRLERVATDYGAERRRLIIPKLRGMRFREGYHDYRIAEGGLQVFPRLVASDHRHPATPGQLLSGLAPLDSLLGGGLDRGTSTIVLGPSGAGKSTLAVLYAVAAARKGERVQLFVMDENMGTFLARDRGLQLGLAAFLDSGAVSIRQIDPAEVSPGEFTHIVAEAVQTRGATHIVIDSLNGLVQSMPSETTLLVQIHELLSFLAQASVTTVMTLAQHGFMGPQMTSSADLSYLTDTIILLRYFEAFGEMRRAISVVKKRTGYHERTVREFCIGQGGYQVLEPLREFHGIITGFPRHIGTEGGLFNAERR